MNISFDKFNNGHTEFVRSLSLLNNNILVSGSRDGSVKIWDLDLLKIRVTYNSSNLGHKNWVSSLAKFGSTSFASGSHDNEIKIWSL